ncbi:MAG: DUF4115 domain-containing protein [Desulfohalobiaceae bacterium]|nr:DUF4115 domain-containing protein [Desulfohalobiaceae bacterium]
MDYKELGQKLKTERERQGLTVSDIHDQLKIGPSSVEAIEAGDVDSLPHIVYYKGFVKNYANFLGLDPAEYLKPFEQDFSLDEDEHQEEIEKIPEKLSHISKGKKWTIASIILGLCLVVILGWLYTKLFMTGPKEQVTQLPTTPQNMQEETGKSGKEQGEMSPEPLENEMEKNQAEDGPSPNSGQSRADTPESIAQSESREETEIAEVEEQESGAGTPEIQDQNPEEQAQIAVQEEQTATEAAVERHTLRISASEACWLSAEMDDRSKDIYLRPGESITLRFTKECTVKLGNAGGVRLVYDGSPYEMEAASGEVVTLEFP